VRTSDREIDPKENLDAWKESKGGDEDGGDNITLSLCDACDSQQLENVLSKNGPDNSTSEGNSVETILPFDAIFLDLTGPEHVFKNVLPYLKLGKLFEFVSLRSQIIETRGVHLL
jgi:tRNA A58 N-methylase Trm61